MTLLPRMIMLSGSGKNVGKTTLSTQLIQKFTKQGYSVYAIKTSSHLHPIHKDEKMLEQGDSFDIVIESRKNNKDSSLMLQAGAIKSFYIQAEHHKLEYASKIVLTQVPAEAIIICESGGLREFIRPSLFIYLTGNGQNKNEAFKDFADKAFVFNGRGWDGFDVSMISFNGNAFKLTIP